MTDEAERQKKHNELQTQSLRQLKGRLKDVQRAAEGLERLRAELERVERERDEWRNKALDAASHPVVRLCMQERDAAIAAKEKAEAERDALSVRSLTFAAVTAVEQERDAAVARAEKAEAERDEEKKWRDWHDLQAQRIMRERDAALAQAREDAEAYVAARGEAEDMRRERDAALAQVARLRTVGGQMSNLCFNLAQSRQIPAEHRKTMDELRRQWDAALAETEPKP